MAKTEAGEYLFTVKERGPDDTPFLMAELVQDPQIPELEGKLLSITLRDGTTYEEARKLAQHLHEHVKGLSLTTL